MALEEFRSKRFGQDALDRIAHCNEIIGIYQEQELRLTLRQLYYQLVSRNIIVNAVRSYKNLSSLVSDARLAGLMDWDAIEDRGRQPHTNSEFTDLQDLAEAALRSYRLPRWEGQENYVELWVEKDALAGVLWPVAHEHHVTLMVNKGYSSQSAMYVSAARFREAQDDGKSLVLFYLGDMDPSGEDMVRDIRDRMTMFNVEDIDVQKLALTMAQIRQYNPPPNPAKVSDPRSGGYIEAHGTNSWELDALPPDVLATIVRDAFDDVIDREKMDAIIEREESDKTRLSAAVEKIMTRKPRRRG
jgi:hypothetical protein